VPSGEERNERGIKKWEKRKTQKNTTERKEKIRVGKGKAVKEANEHLSG